MATLIIKAPEEDLAEYAELAVEQYRSGHVSGHYNMSTYWYLENDTE